MGLEPAELARWTRFAAKGGIGKCTASCDCVAESPDDLMFLKASPHFSQVSSARTTICFCSLDAV